MNSDLAKSMRRALHEYDMEEPEEACDEECEAEESPCDESSAKASSVFTGNPNVVTSIGHSPSVVSLPSQSISINNASYAWGGYNNNVYTSNLGDPVIETLSNFRLAVSERITDLKGQLVNMANEYEGAETELQNLINQTKDLDTAIGSLNTSVRKEELTDTIHDLESDGR